MLWVQWLEPHGHGLAPLQPARGVHVPTHAQNRLARRCFLVLVRHGRLRVRGQQGCRELRKQFEWPGVDWSASAPDSRLGLWDTNPLPSLPSVPFSPEFFNGTSILGFGQVHELPRHVNQAYDEQFVLGVQRELPWNMFLSVSAVHTHDIHLPATLESAVQSR